MWRIASELHTVERAGWVYSSKLCSIMRAGWVYSCELYSVMRAGWVYLRSSLAIKYPDKRESNLIG